MAVNAPPLVGLEGVSKAFPGVVANDSIDLSLHGGEVHCLLGENGAGKSTLMHILSGMYQPDAGVIRIEGREVTIDSPRTALELGIGMVYQSNTLLPGFTVLENLMLEARGPLRLRRARARAALEETAALLGVSLDPEAVTGRLPLGRQQQVELIKVLASGSRVVILDEPTAMLTPQEGAELNRVLGVLRERGLAVVFITHKLREALAVADRITVLRRGRVAGRLGPAELRGAAPEAVRSHILALMFGSDASEVEGALETEVDGVRGGAAQAAAPPRPSTEEVLRLEGVTVESGRQGPGLRGVSFVVHRGEVFGIAGVDGNGQRELAEVIAGQRAPAAGRVWFEGQDITLAAVRERQELGVRFVTDDRLGEAVVPSLPVYANLLLKRLGHRSLRGRVGRLSDRRMRQVAASLVEEYDIRTAGLDVECGTLSGGNLQKLVLARESAFDPQLVVYDKPAQGLDVMTAMSVRSRLRAAAEEKGVSAVLISTDLEELVSLCHRIGVMFEGRLVGIVDNDGADVEMRVGAMMIGEIDE